MLDEGNLVALRPTLSATHTTDAFGVPTTGKRFAILTMDMHRIADGRTSTHGTSRTGRTCWARSERGLADCSGLRVASSCA